MSAARSSRAASNRSPWPSAQMEKVTQRNAANAEESAAASEELAAQARASMKPSERLRRLQATTICGAARAPRSASHSRGPRSGCGRAAVAPAFAASLRPVGDVRARTGAESFPLDDSENVALKRHSDAQSAELRQEIEGWRCAWSSTSAPSARIGSPLARIQALAKQEQAPSVAAAASEVAQAIESRAASMRRSCSSA